MNGKQKRKLREAKRMEQGVLTVPDSLPITEDIRTQLENLAEEIGMPISLGCPWDNGNIQEGTVRTESLVGSYTINYAQDELLLALDHKQCFNKISQCPVWVRFPVSKRVFKGLVSAIKYLGTKGGREASNTFEFPEEYAVFGSHVGNEFYGEL